MNLSSRDPYPPSKRENDYTLSGYKPQHKTYKKPTHLAQTEEPWSHLHGRATSSSFRRSALYCDGQASRDSLDLHLKSVYDHHKNVFWSKHQILYQKDTVCEEHRHTEKKQQEQQQAEKSQEIRRWVYPYRHSIYSIK
ncbi:unnamed protein product [Knipowitschia caucasica]|uniref:Uncharacterized protein n=1 Tax=Knipowitschia caucasica TaxID=637954 RepID=A0AAV2LY97_KNICA